MDLSSDKKTAVYLDDLSLEQLMELFKHDPQFFFQYRPSFVVHYFPKWVAKYKPTFMVKNFPKYMLEHHLDWVCFNEPTLALAFEFDYLLNKNPGWVVQHAQEYLAYSHPDLLQSYDVDQLKKYRTDEAPAVKTSFWTKIKSKFGKQEAVIRYNPMVPQNILTALAKQDWSESVLVESIVK